MGDIRRALSAILLCHGSFVFYFAVNGDGIKALRGALKKRRQIQRNRRVNDDYIWGLLEKELFLPRLTRRLRKN